jgi:hypothetical protein
MIPPSRSGVKHDTPSNNMMNNFSNETITWLGHWLSGGANASDTPATVFKELNELNLRPPTKIRIYRGLKPEDNVLQGYLTFSSLSSWTLDVEMAHNFGSVVVSCEVVPTQVFVDTTRIDPHFIISKCSGFPEEKEVILNPGRYGVDFE